MRTNLRLPQLDILRAARFFVSDDHRGHAIFILGPSAAGKSFGLKSNLHRILHTAEWNKNESFHVIDGGIMRECSKMWGEMKSLRLGERTSCGSSGLDGFEDLYKTYFKPHITRCKKALFAKLKKEHRNMLIPDTATSLLKDKTWSKIKELNSAGYKILMCAVVASKGKCEYNGSTRQRNEGKIYSSIGWSRAMTRVRG